jgi:acyl-coenzyme A thioesterase PaaI-like protein
MTEPHAVYLPWQASEQNNCFGCSLSNPAGLGIRMTESDNEAYCDISLTHLHESYPGIVHGGIAAAILDELMGNLIAYQERKICFTAGLRFTYVGALRVGQPYRGVARMKEKPEDPAGIYKTVGEIRDAEGRPLVLAKGSFIWFSRQQYIERLPAGEALAPELLPFLR